MIRQISAAAPHTPRWRHVGRLLLALALYLALLVGCAADEDERAKNVRTECMDRLAKLEVVLAQLHPMGGTPPSGESLEVLETRLADSSQESLRAWADLIVMPEELRVEQSAVPGPLLFEHTVRVFSDWVVARIPVSHAEKGEYLLRRLVATSESGRGRSRELAIRAVGRLGRAAPSIACERLQELMDERHPTPIRMHAAMAARDLGKLGHPMTEELLKLANGTDPSLELIACLTLVSINPENVRMLDRLALKYVGDREKLQTLEAGREFYLQAKDQENERMRWSRSAVVSAAKRHARGDWDVEVWISEVVEDPAPSEVYRFVIIRGSMNECAMYREPASILRRELPAAMSHAQEGQWIRTGDSLKIRPTLPGDPEDQISADGRIDGRTLRLKLGSRDLTFSQVDS